MLPPQPTVSRGPSRLLSETEVRESAERLSRLSPTREPLPPIIPKQYISREDCAKSVDRLYRIAIEKKQKAIESMGIDQTAALPNPSSRITAAELEDAIRRLYDNSITAKQKMVKDLEEKMEARCNANTGGLLHKKKRFGSKEEEVEANRRLYDTSVEKERQTHRELFDKYVLSTAKKYPKRTKEELDAAIAKLTEKK